jgi:prevent-host-death family protein
MCNMESVGVRELRQNASKLIEKTQRGVSVQITNHGKPVAWLVPVPPEQRDRDGLIAAGLLRPGSGALLAVQPVDAPDDVPSNREILDNLGEDRLP